MKLLAMLCLFEGPVAAFTWLAFHTHADGIEGGVYWCAGLLAVLIGLFVLAARFEPEDSA